MSARTQNKPQRIGTAAFNYRFRACKSGRLIKKQLSTAKGSIFASPPKPPGQSCGWMKTRARGRFSEATWYRQAAVAESPPTHRQHYAQQHQRPPLRTSDLGLSTADEQDPQQVGPFQSLQQTNQKTERAKNNEKEQSVSFSKNAKYKKNGVMIMWSRLFSQARVIWTHIREKMNKNYSGERVSAFGVINDSILSGLSRQW